MSFGNIHVWDPELWGAGDGGVIFVIGDARIRSDMISAIQRYESHDTCTIKVHAGGGTIAVYFTGNDRDTRSGEVGDLLERTLRHNAWKDKYS